MGKRINEALRDDATRRFFTFQAPEPETDAPECLAMSRQDWESLSPGMRREISREYTPPADDTAIRPTARDHKHAVEYAGRKRL